MRTHSNTPRIAALAALLLAFTACGGGKAGPGAAVALTLAPDQVTLALGTGKTFAATAWYEDGSTLDVTDEVAWTTLDGAVAGMGAKTGRVKALGLGTTQLVATLAEGLSAAAPVQVTPAVLVGLAVTPTAPS